MVAIPVKGEVLVWARTERGLTPEDAAERLEISQTELFQLERGERDVTLGELERIAVRYQFPLATLLMPAPLPPVDRPKLKDFRAFEGAPPGQLAAATLIAIEEAFASVEAFDELRAEDPALFFSADLPEYALTSHPEDAAIEERAHLGVSVEEQLAWLSDREAFFRWREVIESQGVFAYQMPLGEDDSRGFAIWDERRIPIIVIDSSEEDYPARTFTLVHEYAHILLRMGGISNQNNRNAVERFCNQFAAFFLMPRTAFEGAARLLWRPGERWTEQSVGKLASQFKVSKSAVALHLEDIALAPKGFYAELLALWRTRSRSPKAGGIATHIAKHANRLGSRHLDTVFKAMDRGLLNKLDAFELTNVKPRHFPELRTEVTGRRIAFGRGG